MWLSYPEIVKALGNDAPVPEEIINQLEQAITEFDCENWQALIGHAIVNRLKREHNPK